METMSDGTEFNPAPICQVPNCTNKSAARLKEIVTNDGRYRRKDLCTSHAMTTKRYFKEKVEVVAAWGTLSVEEYNE